MTGVWHRAGRSGDIFPALILIATLLACLCAAADGEPRIRILIETDAGGDPDDEQSLVRFLLYANEWDIEGIIANRPVARDGENRNSIRTGLGIVQRLVNAYGECRTNLVRHDPRYPAREFIRQRTVAGGNETDDGVKLLVAAVDNSDPRPLWYSDWGTDHGAATNNLRRALDRILQERGPAGYAAFKSRLRLASADAFGPHTTNISPAFALWVNTFQPEREGRRWYHRFSALTSRAGGFDLARDVLLDHGPLGALYPTNTTHWAKEGDTLTFLYLVPNGLNSPDHPGWGGWAGRYGPRETMPGRPYYWANQIDGWKTATNRDNTLARWAVALQNDFRARLDWCVRPWPRGNHPPVARVDGPLRLTNFPGDRVTLTGAASSDPDSNRLSFHWEFYSEAGTYQGPLPLQGAESALVEFVAPAVDVIETIHLVLSVTDDGAPALTRYQRVVVTVDPLRRHAAIEDFLHVPREWESDFGNYRSPLEWPQGGRASAAAEWPRRRAQIATAWHEAMGAWPALLEQPGLKILASEPRENFTQHRVQVEWTRGEFAEGWLLVPAEAGPLPAVLVPFYDPETSIGIGASKHRDFALQLARRGFVTLAIGAPSGDARRPDTGRPGWQPLSYLAYLAANCHTALAQRREVDPRRIGVVGHSYGGKWAMFAAALYEKFACCVASDPGIVWDESRANVNYWEPWYLGRDAKQVRQPGLITPQNPRTGAYRDLTASGHDLHELHSLLAPRPFLVSGGAEDPPERWRALNHLVAVNRLLGFTNRVGLTSRKGHEPTAESNDLILQFFDRFLK
ncbi:MAG: hypothetical protein QOF48_185 [Verrucomicrobiota bacterium]|jgi:hypothetical protein